LLHEESINFGADAQNGRMQSFYTCVMMEVSRINDCHLFSSTFTRWRINKCRWKQM